MNAVKNPKASVKFYEHLGMKQVNKFSFPDNQFDLYFLAYDSPKAASSGNHCKCTRLRAFPFTNV